jgi:hypothetical protein
VSYGRSIPTYPEEWCGCTTLGLPAVTSDLVALDRRTAVLLERHVPGYREIISSELPCFVKESAALVFGK